MCKVSVSEQTTWLSFYAKQQINLSSNPGAIHLYSNKCIVVIQYPYPNIVILLEQDHVALQRTVLQQSQPQSQSQSEPDVLQQPPPSQLTPFAVLPEFDGQASDAACQTQPEMQPPYQPAPVSGLQEPGSYQLPLLPPKPETRSVKLQTKKKFGRTVGKYTGLLLLRCLILWYAAY